MLYGIHPVSCAVAAGHRQLRAAWVATSESRSKSLGPVVAALTAAGVPVTRTDATTLGAMAGGAAVHQGIVVAASPLTLPVAGGDDDTFLAAMRAARAPTLVVVLDGVTDPHNAGAVLRSAALLGVDAVLLPLHASAPLNATVSKTSSGALELLAASRRLWHVRNVAALLPHLQEAGWRVLVAAAPPATPRGDSATAAPSTQQPHLSADALRRDVHTVLILGSEGAGVRKGLRDGADATVSIAQAPVLTPPAPATAPAASDASAQPPPPLRLLESLNVSVAAGVLFHALRPLPSVGDK